MSDYPKTKYHVRGGGSIQVTSAAQDKALGADWVEIAPMQQQPKPKEKQKARAN